MERVVSTVDVEDVGLGIVDDEEAVDGGGAGPRCAGDPAAPGPPGRRAYERTAGYLVLALSGQQAGGVTRVDIDTLTQFGFGMRMVVIDRVDQHATVPSVTVDNRLRIELAFDHLRSLGHRRVGYVSGISGTHGL